MKTSITFRGYLTFEDSLKLQRALRPKRLLPPTTMVTVITLVLVSLVLTQMRMGLTTQIFLVACLGIFMAGGFWIMNTSARKTQKQLYQKACIKRRGMMKEDGIHIKKGQSRTTVRWDQFDRIIEIDGILAIVKNSESLGFAMYMFTSEAEWNRAQELIRRHYP